MLSITINQLPFELPPGSTLQDAVDLFGAKPPFAAALNLNFIPKTQYAQTPLKSTDEIELISPITGG
jgi:sulfur carrier protein